MVAPNADAVQPIPRGPRVDPNRHPSGLHDWPNANLLCLNAYTSKYLFAAGSIRAMRLYTQDSSGKMKLLGTAPVERDGSFFVHVPSDQALQIELLDAAGKTLKRESGFFWMRRGEQRVCVGCHAGPETAPENAVPQILLKSTIPTDMTIAQNALGGN
jgi:Hydrazine synthase alpha subunit middle domain